MLNEKVFEQGIEKLVIEFAPKGFVMNKKRTAQWYEYLKNKSDKNFKWAVDEVLKTNRYAPTMADIVETLNNRPREYPDLTNYEPGEIT